MFNGTIRKLEEKDVPQVEAIFDLYWSGGFRTHLTERLHDQDINWVVAEEKGELVGVAALREAPERMRTFAKTDRVAEFYVAAAKHKGRGIGSALRNVRIEQAREQGYTEAVFFSGNTHSDSWKFHDDSEFKRVGNATAPSGENGKIWLMAL